MSFVDRWLYSSKTGHNAGTRMLNTGDNKTTLQSVHGQFPESEWATQKKTGTSPNLNNVPWRYYKDVENSRRGSCSSTSSVEEDLNI